MQRAAGGGVSVIRFPVERRQPVQLVDMGALIAAFGFSERWWRYRLAEGLPSHRWGGRLRFDLSEVRSWLEATYGEA